MSQYTGAPCPLSPERSPALPVKIPPSVSALYPRPQGLQAAAGSAEDLKMWSPVY